MPDDDALNLAREIAASYRKPTAGQKPKKTPDRPRRKNRADPQPLSEVLEDMVRKEGWTTQLAAQRLFTDWASIVGPEVASHTVVDGYEDGIVRVVADSTAWATQLRLLAPQVVLRLNQELGDGSVLRIDVRGPAAPSWVKGKRHIKGRGPRDTYG